MTRSLMTTTAALLGSRVGDCVAWWADSALQMARVERLLHQPEADERELLAALAGGAGSTEPFLDFDPVLADGASLGAVARS